MDGRTLRPSAAWNSDHFLDIGGPVQRATSVSVTIQAFSGQNEQWAWIRRLIREEPSHSESFPPQPAHRWARSFSFSSIASSITPATPGRDSVSFIDSLVFKRRVLFIIQDKEREPGPKIPLSQAAQLIYSVGCDSGVHSAAALTLRLYYLVEKKKVRSF